jgi:phage shock protein PspC (stress-responsive transcriptional regulator)
VTARTAGAIALVIVGMLAFAYLIAWLLAPVAP